MIIDRLDEEFLLFSLRRDGRWVSRWTGSVSSGVAGAWVLELLMEGRLKLKQDRLVHRGKSSMDDPVLDGILEQIRAAKHPRKVSRWVARLARHPGRRMVRVMHRLEERGYVEHKRGIGLLGRTHRFPQRQQGGRTEMRDHLVEVVAGRRMPDEDTVALLGVLDAAGMGHLVFGSSSTAARRAIKRLAANDHRVVLVAQAVRRQRVRRFFSPW